MKKYIVPKAKVVNLGPMNFLMGSNGFVDGAKKDDDNANNTNTGFTGEDMEEGGWGE